MAARYWVGGGSSANWDATGNTNWGTASGTRDNASVPTSVDDVTFDGGDTSSCTIANAANAKSLSFTTGYTGTITYNNTLTVAGAMTLRTQVTFAGSSALIATTTATHTSNGKTVNVPLTIMGNQTHTLADDWTCSALVTLGGSSASTVINGNHLYCQAGLTVNVTTGQVTGTTELVMSGTGTWSMPSRTTGSTYSSLTFDAGSGTITVSGTVSWGTSGKTLKYTSGTINVGTSSMNVNNGATLDVAAITWYDLTHGGNSTITLAGDLNWSHTLTISNGASVTYTGSYAMTGGAMTFAGTGTQTFNVNSVTVTTLTLPNTAATLAGSTGVTAATWANTALSGARIWTLTYGNTYRCTGTCSLTGASSTNTATLISSDATSKVVFILGPGVAQDMVYVNATRVDSSAGQTCFSARGVLTNSVNWLNAPVANEHIWPAYQLGM